MSRLSLPVVYECTVSHYDHTPTEELILEVLTARTRLGETFWTFSSRPGITGAAKVLERKGLVFLMSGQVERTFRAGLTERGKEEMLFKDYVPPIERAERRCCCHHPDVGSDYACAWCRIGEHRRCILKED